MKNPNPFRWNKLRSRRGRGLRDTTILLGRSCNSRKREFLDSPVSRGVAEVIRVAQEVNKVVVEASQTVEASKAVAEVEKMDAIRAKAEDHHLMLLSSSRSDPISQMIAIHSKYTHYYCS
jgi:hypothetical protein